MKSQTQRFRAMAYLKYNDGRIHTRNEVYSDAKRILNTTQEWIDRWLDDMTQTEELEWLGNGRFVVVGPPTQLTLKDV
ncbi:MAG: hypothetical protein ACW99U_20795 [Candidatus Thorarchaeota archaeon]|jgi:hypothetical protein